MIWFLEKSLIYVLAYLCWYWIQLCWIIKTNNQFFSTLKEIYNDRRIQGWTKRFKKYIEWEKKLKPLKEQEINEIKNETKRKLNMLDNEINSILEKLDENLRTLEPRCIFCENPCDFKKERELKLWAKEK